MDYHAHSILDMMEGHSYTEESLLAAIVDKFGADATFHTCSCEGMSPEAIIQFLKDKGKFMFTEEGFTVDITRRCNH